MAVDVNGQLASANAAADAAEAAAQEQFALAETKANQNTLGYIGHAPVLVDTVTPPAYSPNAVLPTEFKNDYKTVWQDLEAWVTTGSLKTWLDTNFPALDPAIIAGEDAWLVDVLTNGYSGIPAHIEQMLWDRARSKDIIEAVRLEDEAATSFSSRGFGLPPGALVNRTLVVQRDAANKSSTIARDQAIKQLEMSIEMTKLAITEVTKLRLGMAQALADYLRAWMELPKAAADIAKIKSDFYNTLWGAAASYGNMQVNVARLGLDASKANSELALDAQKLTENVILGQTKLKVDTAINSATAMAQIASAARGSNNSLVGSIETANTQA